ncbi:MAG: cupin domain-containing protein [Chloroflexota bacterium]
MPFFDWRTVKLQDFRPGIRSHAILGEKAVMAVMEVAPGFEDPGHSHLAEQCGIVLDGEMEMSLGQESQHLGAGSIYFIPPGIHHRFRVLGKPAKVMDFTVKL